jgi:hypothetical protein
MSSAVERAIGYAGMMFVVTFVGSIIMGVLR